MANGGAQMWLHNWFWRGMAIMFFIFGLGGFASNTFLVPAWQEIPAKKLKGDVNVIVGNSLHILAGIWITRQTLKKPKKDNDVL